MAANFDEASGIIINVCYLFLCMLNVYTEYILLYVLSLMYEYLLDTCVREAPNVFSGCSFHVLVLIPRSLKIVVEFKFLELPQILRLWSWHAPCEIVLLQQTFLLNFMEIMRLS